MKNLRYGVSLKHALQLGEIAHMTAEELLEKYKMVIYSQEDIDQINYGMSIIQEVLNRNGEKIKEAVSD